MMMNGQNKHFDKYRGSALILVVVVTVLLAVVGVMFMMVSRVSEMETVTVTDQRDLESAVNTVVSRIDEVLVDDLFGADGVLVNADGSDEAYDAAGTHDPWLASLDPSMGLDGDGNPVYYWQRITDLYDNNFGVPTSPAYYDPQNELIDGTEWDGTKPEFIVDATGTIVKVITANDRIYVIEEGASNWSTEYAGARADADGDGVADSRWVKVPGLSSSRGRNVFAAVRIIDNCGMLNLNAAYCFFPGDYDGVSLFEKPWYIDKQDHPDYTASPKPYHDNQTGSGHYLTDINYLPFLRGHDLNGNFFEGTTAGDDWYNLMLARNLMDDPLTDLAFTPQQCQAVLMNIESPGTDYPLFGIGDELEIRNRYMLTSRVEARFEQKDGANFSLDSGGGAYAALKIPRNLNNDFDDWKRRIDPLNFDAWDQAGNLRVSGDPLYPYIYTYDRRHVCTFYSFDRDFRNGDYTLLNADLTSLAISLGWTQAQKQEAEKVFRPVEKGLATTDIYALEYNGTLWTSNNVETRRRIVHLLYALRDYFYGENGGNRAAAAKSAAQVVANLIDYSDDDASNPTSADREGPFYDALYGTQANKDCTFITETMIEDMIDEVSGGLIPTKTLTFGLTEIIFGYERQPFFSEIYANWNEGTTYSASTDSDDVLNACGIELVNPYPDMLDMEGWKLVIGDASPPREYIFDSDSQWDVPGCDQDGNLGRVVYHGTGSVPVPGGVILNDPIADIDDILPLSAVAGGSVEIKLMRPAPSGSGVSYICVDSIGDTYVRSVLNHSSGSEWVRQRDDDHWKFVFDEYHNMPTDVTGTGYEMGKDNNDTTFRSNYSQVGAADDAQPANRRHDLEILALFGNGSDPNDVTMTITHKLYDAALHGDMIHFDLNGTTDNPSDYITTIGRPDEGSVPGRINVNTAPAVVIAAAIPPTLADPNAATGDPVELSALKAAQAIVDHRPYQSLDDLLNVGWVQQYTTGGAHANENVGTKSIEGDIEEDDWVLSNLANKLTVRSDVFTAYILVRLGESGPQRRMLAIFDRSQVWDQNDRPKLVALHPMPDPR